MNKLNTSYLLFFTIFLYLYSTKQSTAQNLDNYKYVLVNDTYSFLKEKDEYKLNSLTVFLYEKMGFNVVTNDKPYPLDLASNNCLGLKSTLIKHKSFLKTKLQIELRDCNNVLVYMSEIGVSSLKDYQKSYHEALRQAFKSMKTLNYGYKLSNRPTKEKVLPAAPNVNEISKDTRTQENHISSASYTYIAQKTENGYNFYHFKSKELVYQTFQLSVGPDVYLIVGAAGVIYQSNTTWVREFIRGEQIVIENLSVAP